VLLTKIVDFRGGKCRGIKINSTSELHELIIQFNPGDEINCTIQREEQIKTGLQPLPFSLDYSKL